MGADHGCVFYEKCDLDTNTWHMNFEEDDRRKTISPRFDSPLEAIMKTKYRFFLLLSFFFFSVLFIKTQLGTRRIIIVQSECENYLNQLENTIPVPAVLIDLELLKNMENSSCTIEKRVKVAVDQKYSSKHNIWNQSAIDVSYFKSDDTKDYLEFQTNPIQLIPKNVDYRMIGKLKVPTDAYKFSEFFRRARFVKCANRTVLREKKEARFNAQDAVDALALLRDELLSFGMFPFITDGTLLGWYRECSVIPHTQDLDMAVLAWNFNMEYVKYMEYSGVFRFIRKLGRLNDSYEVTVAPRNIERLLMDVFLMYNVTENGEKVFFTGGMDEEGNKIRFTYPSYDPWCVADLLGHWFWVSCTPEDKQKISYGDKWYEDHDTADFPWKVSPRNAKASGKWTEEQMKDNDNFYV